MNRIGFTALVVSCLSLAVPRAVARTVIPLSGPGWTADGQPVCVPHTWNAKDGSDDADVPRGVVGCDSVSSPSYERKSVTYRRAIPAPKKGKRYHVRCEGASVVADACVNGVPVGRHVGAFTAFTFEITGALKPAGNTLEITVDNTYSPDTPPASGDFTICGGLYRKVWLIETDHVCINPACDGTDGVVLDVDADCGVVVAHVEVSGGTNETQRFHFPNRELWSPETPKLYEVTVRVVQGGCEDSVSRRVGFRRAEFRADGGFYLNGVRRQIRGVCRHQDLLGKGWAISDEDERRDVRIIREMGADGVRSSHYPQSAFFYDLCDENGIMAWMEVPLVDHVPDSKAFRENAQTLAREMVRQYAHHPAVVVWGLFNEPCQPYLAPHDGAAEKMATSIRDLVRRLDPSRATVGAGNVLTQTSLHAIPDQLGMNLYPGWYGDYRPDQMDQAVAEVCATNRRASIAISEYGCVACVEQHADPRFKPCQENFHPEEYQAFVHCGNYRGIKANPQVWGSFVWNMFDFASDTRQEGYRQGVNDKGLVSGDRSARKDAYFLYKANWNPEPMLHLVGKRMRCLTNECVTVMAFCNAGRVSLSVNGMVLGTKDPDWVNAVTWPAVPLRRGKNVIEVSCGAFHERAEWERFVSPESEIAPVSHKKAIL